MATDRQVSWQSGELSETLHGRTDLPFYRSGAATLENWLVHPQGALMNRPGTQHIERLSVATFEKIRPIPYVFDEDNSAILLLGDGRIRPWAESSLDPRFAFEYQRTGTNGSIFGWPWTNDSGIASVRTAQLGKVVTFVGTGFRPQEITRTDTDWTRSVIDFSVLRLTTSNLPSSVEPVVYPYNPNGTAITASSVHLVGNSSNPLRDWQWAITYVLRDSLGNAFETGPYVLRLSANANAGGIGVALSGGLPGRSAIAATTPWRIESVLTPGVSSLGGNFILSMRIYRGRKGVFGYLGEIQPTYSEGVATGVFSTFVDEGAEPDVSNPPPSGTNPFLGTDNWPRCVTYHEGRRFFASTVNQPQKVWGSGVQRFTDFDEVFAADDSDSLAFTLTTSRKNEKIRAMVSEDRLYLLTSAGVRVATGSGDQELITPNSIAARSAAKTGCAALDVVETPKGTWFLELSASSPRVLLLDGGNPQVLDVTYASMHLFEGHTIVSWAWAENPWRTLWAVRDDGVLLSCTFVPEYNVLAWVRHEICDGTVTYVATKPEGAEDGVYLTVLRGEFYDFERMAKRLFTDIRHSVFLDRSKTYNGINTVNEDLLAASFTVAEVGGGGWGPGAAVTVDFDDNDATGLEGRVIQWDDPEGGAPYRVLLGAESPTATYAATVLGRNVETGEDEGIPEEFQAEEIDEWYLCTQSVSGLSHLEGLEVTAVADGQVIPGLTVSGGGVDLGDQYGVVTVGRTYESSLESLDHYGGDSNRAKTKVIKDTFVELLHSRGGRVGGRLDGSMTAISDSIDPGFSNVPTVYKNAKVIIKDSHDRSGRVALVQDQPLPMTVLGITREVEYGGR